MDAIEQAKKDMATWKGVNKYLYNQARQIVESGKAAEKEKTPEYNESKKIIESAAKEAKQEESPKKDVLKESLEKMNDEELQKFAKSVNVELGKIDTTDVVHFLLVAKAKQEIELWKDTNVFLHKQARERLANLLQEKPLVDKDKIIIDNKKNTEGKLSKTDIKDMDEKQQVKILKEFGLDNKGIKKLDNEEKRIKKILQLQK